MGKVEIKFDVDAELVAEIEAAGLDPVETARAGLQAAVETLRPHVDGVRPRPWPRPSDPATADRLSREWAERNKDALGEHTRLIASRGSFADSARRW